MPRATSGINVFCVVFSLLKFTTVSLSMHCWGGWLAPCSRQVGALAQRVWWCWGCNEHVGSTSKAREVIQVSEGSLLQFKFSSTSGISHVSGWTSNNEWHQNQPQSWSGFCGGMLKFWGFSSCFFWSLSFREVQLGLNHRRMWWHSACSTLPQR